MTADVILPMEGRRFPGGRPAEGGGRSDITFDGFRPPETDRPQLRPGLGMNSAVLTRKENP